MKNVPRWVIALAAVVACILAITVVVVWRGVLYATETMSKLASDMEKEMTAGPVVDVTKRSNTLLLRNTRSTVISNILVTLKTEERPTKKHGSGLHRDYYYRIKKIDSGQTCKVALKDFHSKFQEMLDPREVLPYGVSLSGDTGDGTLSQDQGL